SVFHLIIHTEGTANLKDHTTHFACLSLIYSVFIHDNHFQSILLERLRDLAKYQES
ncbi:hypothetical protein LDENG_00260780, partial [Lucifuga dentata]